VRLLAIAAVLACASGGIALARGSATDVLHAVDTGLCPFPLEVTVTRHVGRNGSRETIGPSTIVLRNRTSGRTATLRASGTSTTDARSGRVLYAGRWIWLAAGNHVPYLATTGAAASPRTIDPCSLVADSPPATEPLETPAPWPLPGYALTRIAAAGLTPAPAARTLVRHDHVHLDLIVNGRRLTIPAGVGHAEPVDVGPGRCPPPPESRAIGDCAPGHFFVAKVALSPLHPHTTSGIVHIESDLRVTFTLGQFFDQWGVRFDAGCLGGYCTGGGKELRVFVNGRRVTGDPRALALLDRQEIAVVFGGSGAFRSVPSTYRRRWPLGCGGPGERACVYPVAAGST